MTEGTARVTQTRTALAAAAGLWAVTFGPFVVGGGLPVFRDLLQGYLPLHHFWAERVRAGHLPAWFPFEGMGEPFVGQGIGSTFHPVNLLYLVFSDALALRVEVASAVLVAMAGAVLLARRLGVSAPAAVTGAVALAFNGYSLSMTSNPPYLRGVSLLPFVALLSLEVLESARPRRAAAGLAVAWALIPLGGDAAGTLLAGAVVVAMGLHHGPSRRLLGLAGAGLLAGLLAAPEVLPGAALRSGSILARLSNAEFLSSYWALHPGRWPELLLRDWAPRDAVVGFDPNSRESGRWAESVLLSVPLLTFALAAPRGRRSTAFLGLGVLGLWLAVGVHGGLETLLRRVAPALNTVRYPEKHLGLAVFGFSVAAALGVEHARARRGQALWALAALSLGALGSGLALGTEASSLTRSSLLITAASALATGAVLWLQHRDARAAWLAPVVLLAVLWESPLGLLTVPEDVLQAGQLTPGTARVWNERTPALSTLDEQAMTQWARETVGGASGDLGALLGRASFSRVANLPLEPARERALLGWELSDTRAFAGLFGYDTGLLSDGRTVHFDATPRAWLGAPVGVARPADLLARLRADPEAARRHPLVLGSMGEPADAPPGTVSWVADEVDHLVLHVQTSTQTLLVLDDLFTEGWRVSVDGHGAPLLAANALARGVMVAPGEHEVAFDFEVPGLAQGLALAALGLALLGGLLWSERSQADRCN